MPNIKVLLRLRQNRILHHHRPTAVTKILQRKYVRQYLDLGGKYYYQYNKWLRWTTNETSQISAN
jgi:hypothetical protein